MNKTLKKVAFYGLVISSLALAVIGKVTEEISDKLSEVAEQIDSEEKITESDDWFVS